MVAMLERPVDRPKRQYNRKKLDELVEQKGEEVIFSRLDSILATGKMSKKQILAACKKWGSDRHLLPDPVDQIATKVDKVLDSNEVRSLTLEQKRRIKRHVRSKLK